LAWTRYDWGWFGGVDGLKAPASATIEILRVACGYVR